MNTKLMLKAFLLLMVTTAAHGAQRIVGGDIADKNEFPYIVSLQQKGFWGQSYSHICGGSLIRPNWVLTAAHCVNDKKAKASNFLIKIGLQNLKDTQGVETVKVTKIIVHPKNNAEKMDFDYALLQLEKPSNHPVVALNAEEISVPENQGTAPMTIVAGWGTTSESSDVSPILRKVSVPLATNATCAKGYPDAITDQMICAGYSSGGKDSCQGDSGGPLIIKENNGEIRLVGLVSWGEGCARPNKLGVYSKVNVAVNWINETVKKKKTRELSFIDWVK